MTWRKRLSRRTFLRGSVGGATLALAHPPMEALLPPQGAWADPAASPKRRSTTARLHNSLPTSTGFTSRSSASLRASRPRASANAPRSARISANEPRKAAAGQGQMAA